MILEKSWRKILLTRTDLNRITTRIVKQRVAKSKKHPQGIKEVQVYCVDNHQIKGDIKQAENILKQKIWEKKKKEVLAAEFKKNHGGFFK